MKLTMRLVSEHHPAPAEKPITIEPGSLGYGATPEQLATALRKVRKADATRHTSHTNDSKRLDPGEHPIPSYMGPNDDWKLGFFTGALLLAGAVGLAHLVLWVMG